jgi:hypothetical protein
MKNKTKEIIRTINVYDENIIDIVLVIENLHKLAFINGSLNLTSNIRNKKNNTQLIIDIIIPLKFILFLILSISSVDKKIRIRNIVEVINERIRAREQI